MSNEFREVCVSREEYLNLIASRHYEKSNDDGKPMTREEYLGRHVSPSVE